MTALTVVAPTDAQLGYIASLCERGHLPQPEAIYSFTEAGEIIDALKAGRYDPERYRANADLPDTLRPS